LLVAAQRRGCPPQGIGISICGYLTPDGATPDYVNLHALDGFPLVAYAAERYGLPVVMDNDSNCAVLGETHFGGGAGVDRLMVVTIGAGIGMAMAIGGEVVRLHAGAVGNPGHTIVSDGGPTCVAGCRGCLESLASAGPIARLAESVARSQRPSLLRETLALRGSLSPEDVWLAAEAGDQPSQAIWAEVGTWLGRGLVVVAGGVAGAGTWLLGPLEREMRRVGEPYFTRKVREVRASALGRDSGLLGAASLVLRSESGS
jgi:glucokinase